MMKNYSLIFLCVLILSCSGIEEQKKYRKLRKEVLTYYKTDANPLKEKAARFLVDHIKDKYSLEGDRYQCYADTIKRYYTNPDTLYSKLSKLKQKSLCQLKIKDIHSLSSEYLIENINRAFESWEKARWKEQVSFAHFCEYILPYRIGNEPLEKWREAVLKDTLFELVKDTLGHLTDLNEATIQLVARQSKLKRTFKTKWGMDSSGIPDLPFSLLNILTTGTCTDLAQINIYACRGAGIPVTIDFTPQWANRPLGHTWAVLITNIGSFPFVMPVTNKLGNYKLESRKPSKVYRHIFSENPKSHFMEAGYCNDLPDFFNNPNIIDVTDEYGETNDLSIPVEFNFGHQKFAYLAVSNRLSWSPVAWGKVKSGFSDFDKVATNSVYLPVFISEEGMSYFNFPLIPLGNGEIHFLNPDKDQLQAIELTRKYPSEKRKQEFIDRMIGGQFQLSKNKDFKNAVTVYTIKKSPSVHSNNIEINLPDHYRYFRYLAANETRCNIAEIEIYENSQKISLEGKDFGYQPTDTYKNAFDGDILTYVEIPRKENLWIGVDLGRTGKITRISFIPRNDKNHIIPGDLYELFYWEDGWQSLGKKVAVNHSLVYEKVPTNCLFYLRNYTEGREERIFTYENGKQVWW